MIMCPVILLDSQLFFVIPIRPKVCLPTRADGMFVIKEEMTGESVIYIISSSGLTGVLWMTEHGHFLDEHIQ